METQVEFRPSHAMLTAHLDPGEAIQAEPGALDAMRGCELKTNAAGGSFFGGIKRMIGGESFFMNTYTGGPDGGRVSFAPPTPGDINLMTLLPGEQIHLQSGSFLAATPNVKASPEEQGIFKTMFANESLFFLRMELIKAQPGEEGTVYYNAYGGIKQWEIHPDEGEVSVDTGHLVAFTDGIDFQVRPIGNLRSFAWGGEGLVMRFKGEGKIWVQSHNLDSLAEKLNPLLKSQK